MAFEVIKMAKNRQERTPSIKSLKSKIYEGLLDVLSGDNPNAKMAAIRFIAKHVEPDKPKVKKQQTIVTLNLTGVDTTNAGNKTVSDSTASGDNKPSSKDKDNSSGPEMGQEHPSSPSVN
jgi:ATPase subunit of ABC transporter with duplicated ATPase domains